ncbi:MAG TPA: DUF362 domain-containing protein [Candidatus Deferrimicrobiaceae bacterium]|nr:DUF362 domain-containing protein [Candidatus Deferrimicrobiaceae bacterium]
MGIRKKGITRRDFLRAGTSLTLGGLAGLPLAEASPDRGGSKSRVVLVRDQNVLDGNERINPVVLEGMLDRAVTALLESPGPSSAWKRLVSPEDVVGIKTNVWPYLPTPEPLNAALRNRLIEAGVREERISADDRGVLQNPVFRRSTALINVRPMRTHHWSGLGTLLKNYIMFVPEPSWYHGNACERLGAIWHLPHVRGKTRLNLLVMITPLFHGMGPHHFSSRHTWGYGGLIASVDPVAADATGARILQAKRNAFFGEERPISPPPRHIAAADTLFGLGNSRPERVELVRVGWEDGVLL